MVNMDIINIIYSLGVYIPHIFYVILFVFYSWSVLSII